MVLLLRGVKGLRAASVAAFLLSTAMAFGQGAALAPEMRSKIDDASKQVLSKSGVPSASVAVVKDGQVAFLQAYGNAKLQPDTAAKPSMRYNIGSISKQFTAAAILLLQEQGKLSLDDKVGKWIPDLTRANDITIRQLLSMTSGYQDFWPQDYVMPMMMKPTNAKYIMDTWGKKALDFEPGTKWQYSNTNYVIAGAIVEKASGMPLFTFLRQRIFSPLGMTSVTDNDAQKLTDPDPTGYLRYGLGPLRPAPKEGSGWMFAAGELAMTAEDLAKWDQGMIEKKVLSPASWREMEREVLLANGVGTHYGLGVFVRMQGGKRSISHGGEVSGFTAENTVYPEDKAAIAVLTNQDAVGASGDIAEKIAPILFATSDPETPAKVAQAKAILAGLQKGQVDRSLFTSNANAYFSDEALKDFAAGLAPLGQLQDFRQTNQGLRGGMVLRSFSAKFPDKTVRVWTYMMPDGKLEQYQLAEQ